MKILIVTDAWHPQVNGVVRTYEYLRDVLVARGHEIRIVGPHEFSRRFPLPTYKEIELVPFPRRHLLNVLESFQPDAIHIATEGPLGWSMRQLALDKGLSFTTIYHTHFPDYAAKRAARFLPLLYKPVRTACISLERAFHGPASGLLVATKSLREDLESWGFKPPMLPLTRGATLDLFHPGPKTLFHDLKGPVALYVGRIAIEKNIEAFLNMDWAGSKVLVGEGPALAALTRKYPDAHFTGKKTGHDLADHYRSADVFVFPSKTDTFGMVLVEAMACGLPIAGYDVTGPRDIVTEPFLGVIGDDLGLAARQALTCGEARERCEYAQENYTWGKAADQFIAAHAAHNNAAQLLRPMP